MLPLYVITMSVGMYDDQDTQTVAATHDYNKGMEYVDRMNATYETMQAKLRTFETKDAKKWYAANPRPVQDTSKPRTKHAALLQASARTYSTAVTDFNLRFNNVYSEWRNTNLTSAELELYEIKDNNYWSLVEVPWLE